MWFREEPGICLAHGGEPGTTCGALATKLVLERTLDGASAGRLGRRVSACFCPAHGGRAAAERYLARSWEYLAPRSVTNVIDAGTMQVDMRGRVLVIRDSGDEDTPQLFRVYPTTVAQRATMSEAMALRLRQERMAAPYTTTVRSQAESFADRVARIVGERPMVEVVPPSHRARARWSVALGMGHGTQFAGACATKEQAVDYGIERWREYVRQRARAIRRARGGTLEWGVPLEIPDTPTVLYPMRGESAYDAWARTVENGEGVLCEMMARDAATGGG